MTDVAVTQAAFLAALAEHGIPPDVQELLVNGDGRGTVAPGALAKALSALQPRPASTVRAEALEEAARVADAMVSASVEVDDGVWLPLYKQVCREMAADIAAAPAQPGGGDEVSTLRTRLETTAAAPHSRYPGQRGDHVYASDCPACVAKHLLRNWPHSAASPSPVASGAGGEVLMPRVATRAMVEAADACADAYSAYLAMVEVGHVR